MAVYWRKKYVSTWSYSKNYGNKECPCMTVSILIQWSRKATRSHLALDYVSNPGSLTFMKPWQTWAKFRASLGRILLSCGTCVKLSGFGWVPPWVSHPNNPRFQSKIKGVKSKRKRLRTEVVGGGSGKATECCLPFSEWIWSLCHLILQFNL